MFLDDIEIDFACPQYEKPLKERICTLRGGVPLKCASCGVIIEVKGAALEKMVTEVEDKMRELDNVIDEINKTGIHIKLPI